MISEFSPPYHFLSNFHTQDIYYIDNQVYKSAEHAYHSEKATNSRDRHFVMDASTPGAAKRRGNQIVCRPDWEYIKLERMLTIVRRKFDNGLLRRDLLATRDRILIEGNTWGDTFWGVCKGEGENHLGKILMLVRQEKRDEDASYRG